MDPFLKKGLNLSSFCLAQDMLCCPKKQNFFLISALYLVCKSADKGLFKISNSIAHKEKNEAGNVPENS